MNQGRVKWFNNAKGYGFILPDDHSGDIFAHYSAICMDGYKTLNADQKVQFTTEDGPKGVHAMNIQAIEEDSVQPANGRTTKIVQPPSSEEALV